MRVTSNLQWPSSLFDRSGQFFGAPKKYMVSLDVEWTKNYKIKNGSRPFCYSIVILPFPDGNVSVSEFPTTFGYKSVYVTEPADEQTLLKELDDDLLNWDRSGSLLTGHQLSSDLTTVLNAADAKLTGVQSAYECWTTRRGENSRVFDTRYDVDHLPLGTSRRLVDVCTDLKLSVTQPELARGSMTKLHREYLDTQNELIREQLLTLNIRHGLSTALVACIGMGLAASGARNVNDLIHQEMWDVVEYVGSDQFSELLT